MNGIMSRMNIDLNFANQVLQLQRKGMTVGAIGTRLNRTYDEVLEANRMLGIAMAGESIDPLIQPSDEERAAMLDRMPKRMQSRIMKAR
jgi:hypothetical protein